MKGSSAPFSMEPYQGTIVCDVVELKDISRKDLKKIYIVTKLSGNGKSIVANTSCSYSEFGGRFIPKDRRSESSFENITIKHGLEIGIDIFIKQTFGRKSVGFVTVNVLEVLQSADLEEDLHFSVNPSGHCCVRIRVTPPPCEDEPTTEDAQTCVRASRNGIAPSESNGKLVSVPLVRDDDKGAVAPNPALAPTRSTGHAHLEQVKVSAVYSSARAISAKTLASLDLLATPHEPGDTAPLCVAEPNTLPASGNTPADTIAVTTPVGNEVEPERLTSLPLDATLQPPVNALQPMKLPSRPDMIRKSYSEKQIDPSRNTNAWNSSINSSPPARGVKKSLSERHVGTSPVQAAARRKQLLNDSTMASPVERRQSLDSNHRPFPAARPGRNSTGSWDIDRAAGRRGSGDSITTLITPRQNSLMRQGSLRRQDSLKRQSSGRIKLDDGVHATAVTSSRVSRELIRKLSGNSLISAETELSDNSGGKEQKPSSQVAALSWLEQQVDDSGESTAPHSSVRTPNSTKSESPQSCRSTPNPLSPADTNSRRSSRTLFLPAHSTIQEEAENETVVSKWNKPLRKRLSNSDPANVSSMTLGSTLDENEKEADVPELSLDELSERTPSRGRRSSISTISARARFDENTSRATSDSSKESTNRPLSDRLSISPLQISEYVPNNEGMELAEDEGGGECVEEQDVRVEGEEDISGGDFAVADTAWAKTRGSEGIRATRSAGRRGTVGGRKPRGTLTTMRSVHQWDEKASVADEVKATMQERISGGDTVADEFGIDAGTSPGMECWIVDSGHLRRIDEDDIGTFYDADCYVLLQTAETKKATRTYLTQSVHTWVGSRAQKDKVTIAAYKAQQLCKFLGEHVRVTANVEDEETDSFIEMLFGNIKIMNGSIAQSSLKQVGTNKDAAVRLLEVSAGTSNSVLSMLGGSAVPYMQSIAIDRSILKTNAALILDTGQDVIYQWRGAQASHVSRARVFEAAFSLRSERIKQFPNCKIEVVDEGSEPDHFWEVFDVHSVKPKRRNSGKSTMSVESRNTVSSRTASGSDEEGASEADEFSCESNSSDGTFEEACLSYVDDHGDEDDDFIYDMDDIKEYCADQIDGHTEMQRRQVASKSRVLNPEALGFDEEADESFLGDEEAIPSVDIETLRSQISLYRIGYVDGKLQTSRLCGVNSAGDDFGLPRKELLDSKGVFILDFNDEVYVWTGKSSAGELRIAGTTVAAALVQHSKAEWVEVVTVLEGEESILFKSKFPGWYESEMRQIADRRASWFQQRTVLSSRKRPTAVIVDESVKNMMGYTRKKRHRRASKSTRGRMVCRSSVLAYERLPLDDILDQDDGKGVTVIWKIVNAELRSIPRQEHGHFWTHETYVILYGFTLPKPEKENGAESSGDESEENAPQFVLYFWQGPHSKEKAYPQWKLGILPGKITEWTDQMGHVPQEIRIYQGRETPHFFRIFRHRYVVHIPFLGIVKQRHRSEEKVRQAQTEILKREKLRWNMLPVPRRNTLKKSAMSSPSSSRSLLSAARNSSKHSIAEGNPRTPLSRNNSFSSIDSSVADDISTHASPLPKASFQMETTAGVMLFHIRGLGICTEDVHAVQIEARASRLNSSDCFVCIRPYVSGKTFIWLWVGRGSQFFEQEAAGSIALMIKKWVDENASRNQVRVVEEGAGEWFNKWIAKSFYKALGGFDLYTNFDLLQTPRYLRPLALRYPQMFLLENTHGEYSVTMVERFCQYDLSSTGAVIMDAHYALFVWSGKACSASLRVTAIRIAKRFMGSLRKGFRRLDRQVVEVEQGQEPGPFISCFHGWCDWDLLTKDFIDPRAVRFDQRARMGMLGDMTAYIGKPVEGLTTAQHEALAKEYKKRLDREKKKAAEAKPQKESIRDRVRYMIRQKEEENKESANIAAGLPSHDPPKIVPDASYRSDYHVPPPDSIYTPFTPSDDTSLGDTAGLAVEEVQLVPPVDESVSAGDTPPAVSPFAPPTVESVTSVQNSLHAPVTDSTRLTFSARTSPAPKGRTTGSLIQHIGLSPASLKKTPPRRGSTSEGVTYRIQHGQPKSNPKARRGSVPARSPSQPSTPHVASRRHTATPKSSDSASQTNGVTAGHGRKSSSNLSSEATILSRPERSTEKATPRNSIGSASASNYGQPIVAETFASKLRREKSLSKMSSSKTDPLLENLENTAVHKPYMDYLRNPAAGPAPSEKSITRIIAAAGEEVQQRRRSSASKIVAGVSSDQRRRSSASRTKPP